MTERDRFEAMDNAFMSAERRKKERMELAQEAADRNFKEGLRAAYRDASTRDALAAELVSAARGSRNPVSMPIKPGEGFEGV